MRVGSERPRRLAADARFATLREQCAAAGCWNKDVLSQGVTVKQFSDATEPPGRSASIVDQVEGNGASRQVRGNSTAIAQAAGMVQQMAEL